ncbi:MAG: ABC transporter substrate-binding protein, partial [Candidatus Thorarchaeota archaeon]
GSVFWKETTEVLRNDCYFSNSTYDIYFADLLSKPGFYEVYDAAAEIQKIIHFNVPRLVICPTPVIQPYRTDRFMGLIEDLTRGVSGVWSLCNMYSITGNPGGSVRIGFTSMPGSFNIYTAYLNTRPFFENLWPTLFSIGPDMELIPNIATSMSVERHADNQDIPEGHTRLTIDMIQNATWSDGIPLTAEDVVFTHMYELESGAFGNPAAQDLQGILSIYAPTPYRVVIEYSTESFWYPYNEAVRYIIPKRMFSLGGIGYERWEDWNPVRDPDEPHITCGPFIMNEFISTENTMEFTMKKNPNYHYNASDLPDVNTATPSTTDATLPNPTGLQPLILNPFQFVSVTISTSSSVVILGVLIQILRHKRRSVR